MAVLCLHVLDDLPVAFNVGEVGCVFDPVAVAGFQIIAANPKMEARLNLQSDNFARSLALV